MNGMRNLFGSRPRAHDDGHGNGPRTSPRTAVLLALLALAAALPAAVSGQVERVYHPMYLPAEHNWQFREHFPGVDRLFNAFDYGHGILYENLWTRPDAPASLLEEATYEELTRRILPNPPRMNMPEAAFMPRYARLVPLAKEMFEFAHVLHRQSYDILAHPGLTEEERDRAMGELLEYYRSSDLAFTEIPKGMTIMDEQYFSMEFREAYPRFNGLIWAYHWLQIGVYEPLLAYDDPEKRQAAMQATLTRFWQMLEDPPERLPSEMPMSPAIAPRFTERYPEFAAIFDNLHMMHDVISDILVSGAVARGEKRDEIYRQADLFRDPDAMAVSRDEWIRMALAHGVDAQGGPAVGWLPEAPTAEADHQGHDHGPAEPEPHEATDHESHEGMHHDDHEQMHHEGRGDGEPVAVDQAHEPDVRETVASFHAALAAGDAERALGLLHPDVTVYEQGHAETFEQYATGHLEADIAFAREVEREVVRDEVIPAAGTAVYLAETRVRGSFRDREIDSAGVETVFLVETSEGWRIRHVHWSSR